LFKARVSNGIRYIGIQNVKGKFNLAYCRISVYLSVVLKLKQHNVSPSSISYSDSAEIGGNRSVVYSLCALRTSAYEQVAKGISLIVRAHRFDCKMRNGGTDCWTLYRDLYSMLVLSACSVISKLRLTLCCDPAFLITKARKKKLGKLNYRI